MHLNLPARTSPLHALFSVQEGLGPLQQGTRQPTLFRDAMREARASMERDSTKRAIQAICMRANDDICLVRFGCRGGTRCLWNFTSGRRSFR